MSTPAWRRYLRFWRADVDADIDAELRFHLEERAEELVVLGWAPAAAQAEASRELGDAATMHRRLRAIDSRIDRWRRLGAAVDALRQDARYALRSLGRSRGLATMIVVTLALGFGVNVAMFSFLEQLFVRPPAGVRAPGEIHRLWVWHPTSAMGVPFAAANVTWRQYRAIAEAATPLARVAAYTYGETPVGTGQQAEVAWADAGFLPMLGVRAAVGRLFQADEDRPGAGARVAVLGYDFWRSRFGGDSSLLGRTIEIDRAPYTVIGVAPSGFSGIDLDAIDVWVPLGSLTERGGEGLPWYQSDNAYPVMAVLRIPRGTDGRALAARTTTALRRAALDTRMRDTSVSAELGSLSRAAGPGERRPEVKIATRLAGVALIVLLIACANVTNLFLARAMQRRRETAVRLALGISRTRLTMLLTLEALLLSGVGAVAALLAALWGGSALRTLLIPETHWASGVLDWRLAAGTAVLALACGVVVGIVPALRIGRQDLGDALKAGVREGVYQRSRLRTALLSSQAALSVLLLVGAALFVRSLRRVESLDLGWDQRNLVFVSASYESLNRAAEHGRLGTGIPRVAEELARVPGVESVALTTTTPMWGLSFNDLTIPGLDSETLMKLGPVFTGVSPSFFATTGLRLLRGRGFTDADRDGAAPVVVVSQTMARAVWPQGEAIGRCMILGHRGDPCRTIIGIVEDARSTSVIETRQFPQYYVPLAQAPAIWSPNAIVVRAAPSRQPGVERAAHRLLATEIAGADPWIHSMAELLEPQYRPWKLGAMLFTVFGLLALLVAAVGVHSTLAYTFSQRTQEIGIRMALGARAADVVRLVVREGVRIVGIGILVGVVLSLALGRFIASVLYGVSPHDPLTLAAMALVLLVVAAAAAFVPARRAVRVDPVVALSAE